MRKLSTEPGPEIGSLKSYLALSISNVPSVADLSCVLILKVAKSEDSNPTVT